MLSNTGSRNINGVYIFVDPFNSYASGVTSYTHIAAKRITANGIPVVIIARDKNESIDEFRARVPSAVASAGTPFCVEAPETLATTIFLSDDVPIHIRLHCSRSLGAYLQGIPYNKQAVREEQKEINRAKWVTSPSKAIEIASRMLFLLPPSVPVYPNPAPDFYDSKVSPDIDIMFLGRWQRLKGSHFFADIIKKMPHRTFGVVAPDVLDSFPGNVRMMTADEYKIKNSMLVRSRVIVIPSLFESVSMVGLEALACARPTVIWSHIGLAEYVAEPYTYAIKPWDIKSLVASVEKVLSNPPPSAFKEQVEKINCKFDYTIQAFVSKQVFGNVNEMKENECPELEVILKKLVNDEAMRRSRGLWNRKFRKLVRNPKDFWLDSSLRKIFVPPGVALGAESALAETAKEKVSSIFSDIVVKDGVANILPLPDDNLIQLTLPANTSNNNGRKKLFSEIRPAGRIEFSEVATKPEGLVTAFFYQEKDASTAQVIIDTLDSFSDFRPTKRGVMHEGIFEVSPFESVLSIINRVDVKNKERIGQVNNIVLLNPCQNIASALRSCGYRQRVIAVFLNESAAQESLCTDEIDVLISTEASWATKIIGLRRKITVLSVEQVPVAIRRAIQESAPKSPNLLFPLINGSAYRSDLIDFNGNQFQGIIRLRNIEVPSVCSMRRLIEQLSNQVESMYVLESVYMRYRTLCEEIEQGSSPARLIEKCLQDGVLFHVES